MFDIMELLRKGRFRTDVKLTNGKTAQPPKGYIWFVIGGVYYHVTGTGDGIVVRPEGVSSPSTTEDVPLYMTSITADEITGYYPLFNTVAEPYQIAALPLVVKDDFWITYTSSVNAWLRLFIVEVKL